jgi:hypothetical protein
MNDRFGVRACVKSMAAPFQLLLYLAKIINLAIEDNIYTIVAPAYRLRSAGQVNNGQPAHTNSSAAEYTFTLIIGSPVSDYATHRIEQAPSLCTIPCRIRAAFDKARNSAH